MPNRPFSFTSLYIIHTYTIRPCRQRSPPHKKHIIVLSLFSIISTEVQLACVALNFLDDIKPIFQIVHKLIVILRNTFHHLLVITFSTVLILNAP